MRTKYRFFSSLIFAFFAFISLSFFGQAHAALTTSEITWTPPLKLIGGSVAPFDYNHSFSFYPATSIEIVTATLTLSHNGPIEEGSVDWEIWVGNDPANHIGFLTPSTRGLDQNFTVDGSYFLSGTGILDFHIGFGTEDWKITKSLLEIEYRAVPIPASMLLLGTGLIGLIGFRRRKL